MGLFVGAQKLCQRPADAKIFQESITGYSVTHHFQIYMHTKSHWNSLLIIRQLKGTTLLGSL